MYIQETVLIVSVDVKKKIVCVCMHVCMCVRVCACMQVCVYSC